MIQTLSLSQSAWLWWFAALVQLSILYGYVLKYRNIDRPPQAAPTSTCATSFQWIIKMDMLLNFSVGMDS